MTKTSDFRNKILIFELKLQVNINKIDKLLHLENIIKLFETHNIFVITFER